jgi:hypothetical protein
MFQDRGIRAPSNNIADEFQTISHLGKGFVVLDDIQQLSKLLASKSADVRLIILSDASRLEDLSWLELDYAKLSRGVLWD